MRLALFQPDIAGNVGTILRMAACLGPPVDIIEPCGFPFSDRKLRRAGMDYAPRAHIRRHADWPTFAESLAGRPILLTVTGETPLPAARFAPDDVLIVGSETAGVPRAVHEAAAMRVRIPMRRGMRSLNVAVATAIALGEMLRQTDRWPEGAEQT